ncbi:MAG: serine/threonine protein kinase [bacterium]|nr:serine/threonine protein kinase [bacterium]
MQAERWQRIETLFAAAAERSVGERAEFLETRCGDDPELRTEIERLLDADERAGTFIEDAVETAASELEIGRSIGPYQVIRQLGRGGMSSVHLAVRADAQFRKRVAIKLVRRGMDTDDILRRFRNERQILASLDHPNIAKLLDGGTTDDGLPFFVMDYIEGEPIDTYCDQQQLSIRQRLILLRDVCSAVHYAHRNLVVHRDLKPSNVLVTTDGVPKLLDFGIAKLLNPELTEGSLAPTGRLLRLMTPSYASPEQITGGAITTASDVYSLGVLLYELLTGRRPYRVEGGPEEIERVICTQRPDRPSTTVTREVTSTVTGGEGAVRSPMELSHTRGASPEQLRRALRGDLDNILLMALRKEPARRYGSVEQLAEDLGRHLTGRPVIARKDTVAYRAGKFVGRHRLGVAAAVTSLVLILALTITLAVQSARIRHERDRATHERDRATRVATMLNELFEIADPGEVRGNSITARELLDHGVEQIRQLGDEPETGTLLDTLARLYEELGLYERSIPLRERSLAIYRRTYGDQAGETAEALNHLGRTLALNGEFADAEPRFREALTIRRRLFPRDHPEILFGLNNLALILHDLGDYHGAEQRYEEGLEIQRRLRDDQERTELILLANRALLHYDMGEYQEAEDQFREVLATRRQALGPSHENTARALDSLGMTLHARGRYEEAEARLREGLEIRLRVLGEQHLDVARSRTNLGKLLCDRGAPEEAEPLLRLALEQRLALMGDQHPEVAASFEGLAAWHVARGEPVEAERLYRRALAIYRTSLPDQHPVAAEALLALGRLLEDRGACAEAESLLRQALDTRDLRLSAGGWQIAEARGALGRCLATLGRLDEARPLLEGSVASLVDQLGAEHPRSRRARERLAHLAGNS